MRLGDLSRSAWGWGVCRGAGDGPSGLFFSVTVGGMGGVCTVVSNLEFLLCLKFLQFSLEVVLGVAGAIVLYLEMGWVLAFLPRAVLCLDSEGLVLGPALSVASLGTVSRGLSLVSFPISRRRVLLGVQVRDVSFVAQKLCPPCLLCSFSPCPLGKEGRDVRSFCPFQFSMEGVSVPLLFSHFSVPGCPWVGGSVGVWGDRTG